MQPDKIAFITVVFFFYLTIDWGIVQLCPLDIDFQIPPSGNLSYSRLHDAQTFI